MTAPRRTLLIACLFAATVALYFAGLWGGFVWDDRMYFVENDILPALSPGDVVAIFTRPSNTWGEHLPVRDWLYVLEYRLFGRDPFGYHVVSLALFLLTGLAAFGLLRSLYEGRSAGGPGLIVSREGELPAFFVTAFFMLHPAQVESVAYISGQKDLLFGLFTLCLLYFLQSFSQEARWRLWKVCLVVLLYYLSILSKSTAVATLLFVPLFWLMFLRRGEKRLLKPAVIWAAANIPVVLWLYYQTTAPGIAGAHGSLYDVLGLSPFQVVIRAVRILGAHTVLALKPYPLNFGYPFDDLAGLDANFLFGCAAIGASAACAVARPRSIGTLGTLIFLIYLFPVLQVFVSLWSATVYDRYLFVPLLGLGMALERALSAIFLTGLRMKRAVAAAGLVILCALGALTLSYVPAFRSDVASTRHAYKAFPGWPAAAFDYADALVESGQLEDALEMVHKEQTLLDPPWVKPYFIGRIHLERGELSQAKQYLELASALSVTGGYFPFPNVPLARALIGLGDYAGAERFLSDVISSPIFQPLELYRARKLLADVSRARQGA